MVMLDVSQASQEEVYTSHAALVVGSCVTTNCEKRVCLWCARGDVVTSRPVALFGCMLASANCCSHPPQSAICCL